MVGTGRLALTPQTYRVIGETEVYDTARGGTFEAVLPAGQEVALIQGGHIERVEVPNANEATKSDLLEQARELNIEGRSKMDKNKLANAIANALTTKNEEGVASNG